MHDGMCAATNDSHPNEPEEETEISPSKQNVRALKYLVGRERHKLVDTELGGSASGFDGFEEIMESYLLRGRCEAHARDPDAHLTLDTVVCLGLHVDEEAMSRPARICGG
jgi:hypothetical protein